MCGFLTNLMWVCILLAGTGADGAGAGAGGFVRAKEAKRAKAALASAFFAVVTAALVFANAAFTFAVIVFRAGLPHFPFCRVPVKYSITFVTALVWPDGGFAS
jgi:hypothetical protein